MQVNGNGREKFGHPRVQLSLRDRLILDPTDLLKASMREAIDGSGLSRAQVVDEMNRLSGIAGISVQITEAILHKWLARGSTGHVIPVRQLPIFCQAVKSIAPLAALLPPGAEIVTGEELLMLRWAQAEAERREAAKKARKLAQEAGIQ
jgi:hypothetical protein